MHDFDPATLGQVGDPYTKFAELRRLSPVLRLTNGFWAITGYDAAVQVFRERACVTGPIAGRYLAGLPEGAARDEMSHRINFLDAPDHSRVRALVSKAFTPRRVESLIPWIEATAQELALGLEAEDEFDLMHRLAHQLPSLVISELLGVPADDRNQLTAWSDAVAPLLGLQVSDDERQEAVAASEDFHRYLGVLLDERKRQPGTDLLSALVAAEEDGQRLSRVELLSLAATLYSAGHRTTRDLFTNCMAVLLSTPGLYEDVVRNRWPVTDVINEALRYVTPTLFVARVPNAPVVIGGVEVGAWEPLLVYIAAANRDPAAYDAPEEFRPGREGPQVLSFALGSHFCLGASLARAEAEVMLKIVTAHWPQLKLRDDKPLPWHQRGPFRGLDHLWVRRP